MALKKCKKHQKSLIALLKNLPQVRFGAEIGVWRGGTSWWLLQEFPSLEMIGVDHYPMHHFIKVFDGKTPLDRKREMLDLLGSCTRYSYIDLPSLKAADLYIDAYFDFVFLDGDHSFEATKADINAWWPKVRSGGVLCGHDYDGRGDNMRHNPFGVKRAVDGFAKEVCVEVDVRPSTIWAIRKS